MLTKEERLAIAERARENLDIIKNIYEVLFGHGVPDSTSWEQDCEAVKDRLIELCDTSNMIELPLDKDGEVIHIGDVVYGGNREWNVSCIKYSDDIPIITVYSDKGCTAYRPDDLTNKKPVTIASIAKRIREIASNNDGISYCTSSKLVRIADQLESLGDSDD